MSEKLPTADEIVAALEAHPELFKRVLRRMIYVCKTCDGVGGTPVELDHDPWIDLERCEACEGTGSLAPAHLTNVSVDLGASPDWGRPLAEIRLSILTSREGVTAWMELLRRHMDHPLAQALYFG